MKRVTFLAALLGISAVGSVYAQCNDQGYTAQPFHVGGGENLTVTDMITCWPNDLNRFSGSPQADCATTKTGDKQFLLSTKILGGANSQDCNFVCINAP